MQWLRRNFIAGFFVMVPLFISVAALVWLFNLVDGFTTPLYDQLLGRRIPGLGTVTTLAVIVIVGALARDRIGRRTLLRTAGWLLKESGFRNLDSPRKHPDSSVFSCK